VAAGDRIAARCSWHGATAGAGFSWSDGHTIGPCPHQNRQRYQDLFDVTYRGEPNAGVCQLHGESSPFGSSPVSVSSAYWKLDPAEYDGQLASARGHGVMCRRDTGAPSGW